MAYYRRRSTSTSILEVLSLNPMPYPVLLILAVAFVFLGSSWYMSYEEAMESAEEQANWFLFLVPVALVLLVRWLSSVENPDTLGLFATSPWDRRRRTHHRPAEGSSPWGVAAVIVLLLLLLQYQSVFRDSWLI